MVVDELQGCHIPYGAVRPLFIVFPPPGFNHELRFRQRQKPVLAETLIPKFAVEAFEKRILDRFARLNEVEMHPIWAAQASKAVPAISGRLSRIKVSGNGRVRTS